MKRLNLISLILLCSTLLLTNLLFAATSFGPNTYDSAGNLQTTYGNGTRSDAATAVGHSHTSAATITLTPTSGQFVYITGIDISNCQSTTGVTVAAPVYMTTTNITGSPQYQIATGPATSPGVCSPMESMAFAAPLRSTAVTTAVTFVLPSFVTNQVVSVNVYWYSAP